jgi:hypothetical protein
MVFYVPTYIDITTYFEQRRVYQLPSVAWQVGGNDCLQWDRDENRYTPYLPPAR